MRLGVEILMDQHNKSDITTYVKGCLDVDYLGAPDNPERNAWSHFQADIIAQSSGIFQWAHLVVALINSKLADGESMDHTRHWLQHVPHELSDIYKDMLQNVIKREYRRQSFLLFQWVCHAGRPLSVTEMRHVLAATDAARKPSSIRCYETSDFIQNDDQMKQRIRALSGGLIEVVKVPEGGGKETVQVIHQSVTEFLRARGLAYLSTLDEEDKKAICVMPDTQPQGNDNIHNCPAPFDGSCWNHLVTEYAKMVVIAIFVAMMFSGFPTSPVSS